MSYELRIIFEGIIVMGPPPPEDGLDMAAGPLYGVMPRIARHESRYTKTTGQDPLYLPVHVPVVFTTMKRARYMREPDEEVGYYGIWYPVRERMELSFSPDAKPRNLHYVRPVVPMIPPACEVPPPDAVPPEPAPNALREIDALSDFREVWPARGRLANGMLRRDPPVSELVTCQVFVPSGKVGSGGEFLKKDAKYATFLPKRTTVAVYKKLLPQLVVSVETEYVRLSMFSLDTGKQLDSLEFELEAPTRGPEKNVLRIANADPKNLRYVIGNLIEPDSVNQPSSGKPLDPQIFPECQGAYGDIDFEAGYGVLAGHDDGGGLPIPWVPFPVGMRNCNTGLANPPEE